MKTIGLIGGMSWESSLLYYRIINETVKARLGGFHSAQTLMYSFDFAEIEAFQKQGDWVGATAHMIDAAQKLERGGADCIVICTNTMHLMADAVQEMIDLPLLHIADPCGQAVQSAGIQRIGFLGTRFSMEESFYTGRLRDRFGLQVLIPDEAGRQIMHDIIYEELVQGIIRDESRQKVQAVIADLVRDGAQGIILGCTEICLLIEPQHSTVPVFDTTTLHATAAVNWALG